MNKDAIKCISIAEKPGTFGVEFHNRGYELLGINNIYIPLKVLSHQLENIVRLIEANFRGCSVSMPHKIEVIKYLDELDESAQKCEAVNTISNEGGKLKGYNTDYFGAKKSVETCLGDICGKDVLLIGAGGVARAIGNAVKDLGAKLTITNRTYEKARELAMRISSEEIPIGKLNGFSGYLLINATRVGMDSSKEMIVPEKVLNNFHAVMDVVISQNTRLIEESVKQNKKIVSGKKMAVYQAAEQFKIYTGRELPEEFLERFLFNF